MVLKWEESGEGTPIICLHGFGGSSRDYADLVEHLRPFGKVYVLHLSPLYNSRTAMTFSEMSQTVVEAVKRIVPNQEAFHLIGTSFGGTLSWATRFSFAGQVLSHTMINPMPLDPIPKLKHPFLKWLIRYGSFPGFMNFLSQTQWGQNSLIELGKNFRILFHRHEEHRRFHKRKLDLISYALGRFFWISSNEKWKVWQKKSEDVAVNLLITGHKDPLYDRISFMEYQSFAPFIHHVLPSGEHVATRTHAEEIFYLFLKHIVAKSPVAFKRASGL